MNLRRHVKAFLDGMTYLVVHERPAPQRRMPVKTVEHAFLEDIVILDIDVHRARERHMARRRRMADTAPA